MKRLFAALFMLVSTFGCVTPEGDGIVAGQIYITDCNEGDDYGTPDKMAYFDLRADFFATEVIQDERVEPRQNRIDIRLQKGTGQLGDADMLFIQIGDVKTAAEYFVSYKPMPVAPDSVARASLSLYLTCPSFYDGPDAVPDSTEGACPELTPEEIDQLCDSVEYGSIPDKYTPMTPFAQGHSCMVFCSMGSLHRGDAVPSDFNLEFGDTIAGIYFFTLASRRGDTLYDTPRAGGFVQGNFWMKIIRAKAVQTYP